MAIDAVAHALSDPTRRRILSLVRDDELPAGDLAAQFEMTRPAVSQHLRVLRDADLVSVRAKGNLRLYRARPEGLGDLRRWMEAYWRHSLANLKIAVERDRHVDPPPPPSAPQDPDRKGITT